MMTPTITKKPKKEAIPTTGRQQGFGSRAILFNDDFHTFDEVARQLVRAIRCSYQKGMALATIVHNTGSAVVYEGHLERCEAVVMTLEEIALKAKVER